MLLSGGNIKTLKTKEKIQAITTIENINMTVTELLLIKWRYNYEIENEINNSFENLTNAELEKIII